MHGCRGPRNQSSPAFTLVELLTVVVIISTLAVAAMPMLAANLESMRASALAREIATDMRYARMLAVRSGARHRVSFWEPGQVYAVWIENEGGWDLCEHPVTKKPWKIEVDEHSRYAGLTLKDSEFAGSDYLYYDAFGAPEAGGFVTFTLGNTTRTINVAPLSGKITVN